MIQQKDLAVWVVDADAIAADVGLAGRTNTVLQACFFALTDLMETTDAVARHQAVDSVDLWQAGSDDC